MKPNIITLDSNSLQSASVRSNFHDREHTAIVFPSNTEVPLLRLEGGGDVYVRGEKTTNNKKITDTLGAIALGAHVPTNQIRVKVLKPVGYYDNHVPGEVLTIQLEDANKMIVDGYVEIYLTKEGYNS